MKPKTMILMVVAVACGLGASYMTSKLLAERNKQQPEQTVSVLVARAKIVSWQPLKNPEQLFEVKEYPQNLAPPRAIGDPAELLNQRLNKTLDAGKPVTRDDLLSKEQMSLAEQLQPGQRAIAIKVSAESLVGGFVLPSTRVDVICTTRGNDASSRIILQHMLVLAVDTQSERTEQKTILGQTVTLAATPEEATRLALASSAGELRLLLKENGDAKRTYNVVSKWSDLDKPLNGDPDPDRESRRVASAPTLVLPPVAPDMPAPVPEVKPVVEKKVRRHVMTIRTGSTVEKAVFINGQPEDEDETPAKKEESKPKTEVKKPAPPTFTPIAPTTAPPATSGSTKPPRAGKIN
jgi:pilus assembly protein CpaB